MTSLPKEKAQEAGREADRAQRKVTDSAIYRALVRIGLISYGVVHWLIAWIAVELAWTGRNQDASQQGAMRKLASQPVGRILLIIVAVGLLAMVLWQVIQAIWGFNEFDGRKRLGLRLSAAGRAVVYVVIGYLAAKSALGKPSSSSRDRSMAARVMDVPAGRVLVVAIGIAVLGVGIGLVTRGVRTKFTEHLRPGLPHGTITVGRVGYVAKGVAFVIMGGLFAWAALAYEPSKAGGLDSALHTIKAQPFGPFLLTAMAAGFASFGLYCFAWARNAKF
jgi:Domain of Unknown Function (DUF1206)